MKEIPDYKSLSRGISDDMSSEAIARRLEIASQLWAAANELGRSTYLGKVDPEHATTPTPPKTDGGTEPG